mmetsp:Transcript_78357/g.227367  ORF Transcript_78357/g.227367 Transcript_78357/m.227367 type:complete len:638 (-) Transcript_78357:157-2070(-)|eukprot:CAMPEP_0176072764 /NCGR_PEP_ID=MMETSP0120_2-20121206/36354_1 /TAXON_ID=160619 /ORGANISM="Kryptoperidinium foliaceum, Strain CCMP 1326" /LENGTH=637 /DNA_ID=CAMNT_0017406441 /DNA_START=91 /DNA_END=2004 /DNA_ORIENTATION=+
MGKQQPLTHAQRGLVRTFADQLPDSLREDICRFVRGASPLALSDGVARTIRSVGEIYERRGFVSLSEEELSEPVDQSGRARPWEEYADLGAKPGDWESAAFIVGTCCGSWRVVISSGRKPKILAAFPVVGDHFAPPPRGAAGAAERVTCHVAEGSSEWTRLAQLGKSLLEANASLRKCGAAEPWGAWDSCKHLRRLCAEELPELHVALGWGEGEGWQPWARRALKRVSAACDDETCCVPVQSLHFTHCSIAQIFRHGPYAGSDLEVLVEDLRTGRVDPLTHESMVLEVVRYRGKLYSLNNRRLWALQQHQLMLMSEVASVMVRVRVLSWASEATLKRFSKAFNTDLDGEAIRCRTAQDGAPTDGVVATTLVRAVLSTKLSREAEAHRERLMLEGRQTQQERQKQQERQQGRSPASSRSGAAPPDGEGDCGKLTLGGETFSDWREAKVRVQQIMQTRSGGRPVPANELRLLLDVFRMHPEAARKRISEVTSVTVGSSEKFKGTPAFWLRRGDGTSEDISVNKCWKRFDLVDKKKGKQEMLREVVMAGTRFRGRLQHWSFEKGESYGFVRLDMEVKDADGRCLLEAGQKLYLQWDDISPENQRRKAPQWPFSEDTPLSFTIYRWKENGKFGCTDPMPAE